MRRLLEFHAETVQAAPRDLAMPGVAIELKLEFRRHGRGVRHRDGGACSREIADRAVEDRRSLMQNDLAGLQGPVPLSAPAFGLGHDAHQGCTAWHSLSCATQ